MLPYHAPVHHLVLHELEALSVNYHEQSTCGVTQDKKNGCRCNDGQGFMHTDHPLPLFPYLVMRTKGAPWHMIYNNIIMSGKKL